MAEPLASDELGDAAPGDGMRFRHDLLAPVAGLAAGGSVGKAS